MNLTDSSSKCPLCLCNVCLDLVTQTYHLKKTLLINENQELTGFTVGRISEKKRPHPVYVCMLLRICSKQHYKMQHKLFRTEQTCIPLAPSPRTKFLYLPHLF